MVVIWFLCFSFALLRITSMLDGCASQQKPAGTSIHSERLYGSRGLSEGFFLESRESEWSNVVVGLVVVCFVLYKVKLDYLVDS